MKNLTLGLALFTLTSGLIGCTQSTDTEQTTTTEPSEVELIPVATFAEIDVNQAGKVTAAEFVDYYVVKAPEEEKMSQEDAEKKFKAHDKDSNGELTKEEATGEK